MTKFLSLIGALMAVVGIGAVAVGQTPTPPATAAKHRIAIQVNENKPEVMNLALNNVQNILAYYKQKNETVDIQVVAYGPGLHMMRSDTSPVKQRIATMALEHSNVAFAACANTRANQSKAEGRDVPLIGEARVVPSGVTTLIELQEAGYVYLRP
jgi:intracellular sulfur oxidation DsrE/DsrF family protein